MTARVLIVDDIPTNVKLLEARLSAEYFDVVTANSGAEALLACENHDIDIILLDVMMPDMDGFETCRRLKENINTHHIPVVMITALDQPSDRIRGLEAGADDFLNKPVDDMQLMARVKSLVRLKALTDELRARATTGQQIAVEDAIRLMDSIKADGGNILVIDTNRRQGQRLKEALEPAQRVDVLHDPSDAVLTMTDRRFELVIISMELGQVDPLRVCSQLRTLDQGRHVPIILVAEEKDRPKIVRGLELGVNDFIMRPVERNELAARVRTQIRRHRYALELRESVSATMQLAVIDELTGLYNRRYFDRHLSLMLEKAIEQERGMAIMMLDVDRFKAVNDTYGHGAGDDVLREFSERLKRILRGVDLACRYGGEEFVVLMPDMDKIHADAIGERVRAAIDDKKFDVGLDAPIKVTVSVGIALTTGALDTPESLVKRADIALYQAKNDGRNRVAFAAA